MDAYVRRFIRASLVWLGIGVALGVAMAVVPRAVAYRPAHVHANLLGFVSMMIFGVAYHVVPRFTGRPLHSPHFAAAHLWLANAGLAALAGGWIVRVHAPAVGTPMIGAGAAASAVGAYLFIYNLWRTLGDGSPVPVPLRAAPARPAIPVPGSR